MMTSEKCSKKVIVIYCLEERLNINRIAHLKQCVIPFTERSDIHLILDLSRVCFMDCAMIRFLFTLNQLLRKRNSSLSIAHPNRFVELLIDTLKIEKFIPIIQKEHLKNRKI